MKKVILSLTLVGLLFPVLAFATVVAAPELNPEEVIIRIGDLVFWLLLALAALMIIAAGVMFVMAAGSPEGVTRARTLILYALIGVAVAFIARGLVDVFARYIETGN